MAVMAAGATASRRTCNGKITQRSSVSSSDSSSDSSSSAPSPRIIDTKITQLSSVPSSSSSSRNDALPPTLSPARFVVVTMTCLGSEKQDERLILPRSLEELKFVGVHEYGAPFVRVFDEEGGEINDLGDVMDGDRVVFARQDEELNARVTITCFEKGDAVGKPVLLPRSFEELKKIGAKIYGASFVRVLNKERAEIDDIQMVSDGGQVDFASEKGAEGDGEWFEVVWRFLLRESAMHSSHEPVEEDEEWFEVVWRSLLQKSKMHSSYVD